MQRDQNIALGPGIVAARDQVGTLLPWKLATRLTFAPNRRGERESPNRRGCYALLAIYFARSSKRLIGLAIVGLVLCAASTAYCASTGLNIYGPYCGQNRYGVLQAGFIPFATGGLVYFHKDAVAAWVRRYAVNLTVMLVLCELASYFSEFFRLVFSPFIESVGIAAFIAVTIIKKDLRADFIGRASYHLFIAHMSVVSILGTAGLTAYNGAVTFVVTIVLCLLLSTALVPIERSIEVARRPIAVEARISQTAAAELDRSSAISARTAARIGQTELHEYAGQRDTVYHLPSRTILMTSFASTF